MADKRHVFLYELGSDIPKCDFDTQTAAGEYLGVSEGTVRRYVNTLKPLRGFLLYSSEKVGDAGNTLLDSMQGYEQSNTNTNCLTERLEELGQSIEQTKSVKIWQNARGETRYSIVVDPNIPNMEEQLEKLAEELRDIQPMEVKYEAGQSAVPISVILYMSDSHVGADNTGSQYPNEYNAQEYDRRIGVIFEKLVELQWSFGTLEELIVIDLGDNLDGYDSMTTRKNHPLKQNMSNSEQFNTYVTTICKLWDSIVIAGIAKSYRWYTVNNSNHSGDFGYMANRAVEIFLNSKYPQVRVQLFQNTMDHFIFNNQAYILCHGKDTEDMKSGLPLYLNDKTRNFISDYIDFNGLQNYDRIHFVKGDLHQIAYEKTPKFDYRNIPSIFGGSKWIMNNFGRNIPGYSVDVLFGENIFRTDYEY